MTVDKKSGGTAATPRDFYGYGPNPPHPQWPGEARIAINLNLNFEAGGERSLPEGDNQSEDKHRRDHHRTSGHGRSPLCVVI